MNFAEIERALKIYQRKVQKKEKMLERKGKKEQGDVSDKKKCLLKIRTFLSRKEILMSDMFILNEAFDKIAMNTKDSNHIFVFVGSYLKDCLSEEMVLVSENASFSYCNVYLDLETKDSFFIEQDKCKDFEETHFVIYLPCLCDTEETYFREFNRLRNWFFQQLVCYSQEEVVEQLKKRRVRF